MTGSNGDTSDAVDAIKGIDMTQVGNVGGFVGLAIGNAIQILFIGYLGASMLSLCDLTAPFGGGDPKTFEFIFPTDLDNLPYSCPQGKDESDCKYKGGEVLTTASGGKQWFKVIFDVLWPMNALSFPYSNYYSNPLYQGKILYGLWDWMAWTCAGAFSKYRAIYKAYILTMAALARTGWWGDVVVFYLVPYLTLTLFVIPPFPQLVGSMLTAWCSVFNAKVEDPMMWAFAPIFGIITLVWSIIASCNCCGGCFTWIIGLVVLFASILVFNINVMWIMVIGAAIGFWSAMVTLFAPMMWQNGGGYADMKKQFRRHQRGLLVYFIISTACGAGALLTPTVASGVITGGLIALYLVLIKGKGS